MPLNRIPRLSECREPPRRKNPDFCRLSFCSREHTRYGFMLRAPAQFLTCALFVGCRLRTSLNSRRIYTLYVEKTAEGVYGMCANKVTHGVAQRRCSAPRACRRGKTVRVILIQAHPAVCAYRSGSSRSVICRVWFRCLSSAVTRSLKSSDS